MNIEYTYVMYIFSAQIFSKEYVLINIIIRIKILRDLRTIDTNTTKT